MDDFSPQRATIPPVPHDVARPYWSVMIPTFNCARYLSDALRSVLIQDLGPGVMQIEVVDDHSNDNPEEIVKGLGGTRVGFFRQEFNVGHVKNFESCLGRSKGHLIHLLHGDDYVREGFYQKLQNAFEQQPEIGAAFCRQIFMDEHGHWQSISQLEQAKSGVLNNWLEYLALEQRIMTPSIVVRREVYEKLGGFDRRLSCSEDWEMWVRIAAHYPIWYETEPLAVYRMHSKSNTGRHYHTGEEIRYTREAITMIKSYLPHQIADGVWKRATQTYAISALDKASSLLAHLELRVLWIQIKEAFKLNSSLRVVGRGIRLALQLAIYWVGWMGNRWKRS